MNINLVDFGFRFDALPLLIAFVYLAIVTASMLRAEHRRRKHNQRVAKLERDFDESYPQLRE